MHVLLPVITIKELEMADNGGISREIFLKEVSYGLNVTSKSPLIDLSCIYVVKQA